MPATEEKRATAQLRWRRLEKSVVACRRCARLLRHRRQVARIKRRAYRDDDYWGRPVPGFGDRRARILILGLAPGAHGANRTGRMFTGDDSGDCLYRGLYRAGLCNQPESISRDDGLALRGVFVTNACRCVPPQNRPSAEEIDNCSPFLDRELELLPRIRVILALGGIAWKTALARAVRVDAASVPRPRPRFAHGARVELRLQDAAPQSWLLGSYHPSRQNTQTGRLTERMLDRVIATAVQLAGSG